MVILHLVPENPLFALLHQWLEQTRWNNIELQHIINLLVGALEKHFLIPLGLPTKMLIRVDCNQLPATHLLVPVRIANKICKLTC